MNENKRPARVGIIGAMTAEMDAIKASIESPETERFGGVDFVSGTIYGVPVVAATCGMGKVFAAACTQAMILKYRPELIINVGVAGSLCRDLNIGDIAVADCVVQHDMDCGGIGDPQGMIHELQMIEFPCCEKTVRGLLKSADRLGFYNKKGVIASGDVFVQDGRRKASIADTFGAISCEMEGASVGHVCYVNGTPFCVLRAISDNGDETATGDFDMSLDMAAERATRVMEGYLKDLAEEE